MKHIIELCPGDWVDHLSKKNEEVGEINRHQKATGKRRLVQKVHTIKSGNVLGAFYQQLHIGIKDT